MTNKTTHTGGKTLPKICRSLLFLAITVLMVTITVFCLAGCLDYSKDLAYSYNDDARTATVIGIGTFDGEELVIPSRSGGYPVVAIDEGAFTGCQTIKSVVIPDSVKTIGKGAFRECSSLTHVTIGKGVEEIGHEAFGYLSNLTELEYNAIECADMDDVFIGCGTPEGLNVTIGADVKKIPATMFYRPNNELHYGLMYYSSVASVVFADGSVCESIGAKAFRETDIGSIVLPDSITTLEEYAFADCKALTDVHMPESLDSIGDFAFQDCSKLSEIDLTDTALTKIGKKAFEGCLSLAAIEIPSSLTTVDSEAFKDDTALKRVNYHGSIDQWANINFRNLSYTSIITATSNPLSYAQDLYINGELVTEARITTAKVGPYAFNNCTNLVRVVIGENVDYIANNAFSECQKLVEVVNKSKKIAIKRGYESNGLVARYALAVKEDEASDIKKTDDGFLFYTADDGGHYLLGYDGTETDLILPENYKGEAYQVHAYAFKNSAITSVVIPNGVTKINEAAFKACSSLKNVVIGDVTCVWQEAFRACKSLTSLTIGEGVETIYQAAFCNCVSLREIHFYAKNCTVFGELGAFADCGSDGDGIKLTIGKQVTRISGKKAFYRANIAELIFEEGSVCESISDEAFKKSSFTSIRLPASIKSIGQGAFLSCPNLSSVQFEEGSRLEVIGAEAFAWGLPLTSITIPKSVVSIGKNAFYCTAIETVTFADSDGWYRVEKQNEPSGKAINLGDPATNARYLRSDDSVYYYKRT